MSEPSPVNACVLVVADPDRALSLVAMLRGPEAAALAPQWGGGELLVSASSGGDDTLDEFGETHAEVVVVTATLADGDTASLIDALRAMVPRAHVVIVVVGDLDGPIRTMVDAFDLQPDRFVTAPVQPAQLRYAVAGGIESARLARGPGPPRARRLSAERPAVTVAAVAVATPLPDGDSGALLGVASELDDASASQRALLRARWSSIADSIVDDPDELSRDLLADPCDDDDEDDPMNTAASGASEAAPLPPPLIIRPRHRSELTAEPLAPVEAWRPGTTSAVGESEWAAPPREPTLIIHDPSPPQGTPRTRTSSGPPFTSATDPRPRSSSVQPYEPLKSLAALDSPRRVTNTGIGIPEQAPAVVGASSDPGLEPAERPSGTVVERAGASPVLPLPAEPLTPPEAPSASGSERPSLRDVGGHSSAADALLDELGALDDFDDALVLGELSAHREDGMGLRRDRLPSGRVAILDEPQGDSGDLFDRLAGRVAVGATSSSQATPPAIAADLQDATNDGEVLAIGGGHHGALVPTPSEPPIAAAPPELPEGRDFARQLRAKMSKMAQRLFQGADAAAPKPGDLAPRHDHSTEIDLASLGEELQLERGTTEIEARSPRQGQPEPHVTHPGSWTTQVRERGLPDQGEVVRGVSDAAMLLAKLFATGATGRVAFRRDHYETIIALDQGRPVFASSSDPVDRMGELLVREGKITASQYERCQAVVAESGRRMGEILVDFGYLKRRELLPAVRRHVEDILYSLFGWERGTYQIFTDVEPSAERIRLSRHPASLVLEGIRRKFDRTALDKLLGGPGTVIEVADRERLGGIINLSDLSTEERAALAAFDGQVDLAQVARVAQIDTADVMPLAWGLCTLGLATARRTDTQVPDESAALVGETDLVIDRERVRARWELVTEADYFALLGVRRDASSFEIRRAYQAARRDFAADCFPGDLRRELAQELDDIANVLDEAFRVLRDDRLRLTYLSNLFD